MKTSTIILSVTTCILTIVGLAAFSRANHTLCLAYYFTANSADICRTFGLAPCTPAAALPICRVQIFEHSALYTLFTSNSCANILHYSGE